MTAIVKPFALCACFIAMMFVEVVPESPLKFGFVRDTEAIIGVAPGGSVARRHEAAEVAVVTTTAVAASSANTKAAANANAAAAAPKAPPPPPPPAAAPAGPLPVGTIVTTLPPGCTPTVLNGVEYQRCGATYYRAALQGSNLVFVVQQP